MDRYPYEPPEDGPRRLQLTGPGWVLVAKPMETGWATWVTPVGMAEAGKTQILAVG